MQLDSYVDQVQQQLVAAAALGDERVREVAAALTAAAGPAVRLAVLSAVSAAADEITAALLDLPETPVVSVRLDADELRVAITTSDAGQPPLAPRMDEGDASARISLRLSESLKADVDTAAANAGISVNTWLVRAAAAALDSPAADSRSRARGPAVNRVTGWING